MRKFFKAALVMASAVFLGLVTMGSGCQPTCGDSCDSDSDCGGDLVCYAGQCAPEECEDRCMHSGVNVCYFNRATCTYISCD